MNKISKILKPTKPKAHHETSESKTALKGITKQFTIVGREGVDPSTFLDAVRSQVEHKMSRNRQTKINLVLSCEMERVDKSSEVAIEIPKFSTKAEVVLESTDISEVYDNAVDKILETMSTFQSHGSN